MTDPNDLRTALTKLAVPMYYDATPGAYPVTAVPMSHLLSALAVLPAPPVVDEASIRERIAQDILAEVEKDLRRADDDDDGLYRVGLRRAARIARGATR